MAAIYLIRLPSEVNIVEQVVPDQQLVTVAERSEHRPDGLCSSLLNKQSMEEEEPFQGQSIVAQPLQAKLYRTTTGTSSVKPCCCRACLLHILYLYILIHYKSDTRLRVTPMRNAQ